MKKGILATKHATSAVIAALFGIASAHAADPDTFYIGGVVS